MKLAIVGTSKLDKFQEQTVKEIISNEFNHRQEKIEWILTGDAKGVDLLVREICCTDWINKPLLVTTAKEKKWDGKNGFKARNSIIAKDCDELICITTKTKTRKCYHCDEDHQRTGGCWTMQLAKKLGKITRLYVV